jgi:cellulose synthase/poly-beta-1,6-N-acetylglucosamine synthase-like glycosyltransferase
MFWLFIIPVLPYFFILLLIYRNLISIKPYRSDVRSGLKVSVVIACKNEEKNILLLLSDLYSQDYPPELFEVIVVDDNSTDSTFELATVYKKIKGLKVIRSYGNGKKNALRAGIETACNELIITTDADCRMGRGWIKTIAAFYGENCPDLIIGPVMLKDKPGFLNRFQELEFLSLQGITAGTAAGGNPVMCNGANLCFTREAYHKHAHNLHDELASGDDIFFLQSLKKDKDAKIMWLSSEESIVTTNPADTISSFLRQRVRWISKGSSYNDRYTSLIAIATFVTILDMIFLLVAGLFKPLFLLIFAASFFIKSIPDLIIISETVQRYGKAGLLGWFIPAQIIYPFYVATVSLFTIMEKQKWR